MTESSIYHPSIDSVGSVTLARYAYQTWFACLLSLKLLNEKSNIEYVFHEHHDDVLEVRTDGKINVYQVKTRKMSKEQIKFNEKPIINTFSNFIKLYDIFGEDIIAYNIVTNYSYWNRKESGNNIQHCIDLCKKGIDITKDKKFKTIIRNLKDKCDIYDDNSLLHILKNTKLLRSHSFESIRNQIITEFYISHKNEYQYSWDIYEKIIDDLFCDVFFKGVYDYELSLKIYRMIKTDENLVRIDNKKITKDTIIKKINEFIENEYPSFREKTIVKLNNEPSNWRNLQRKMTYGGVLWTHVENMVDLSYSTELLFKKWIDKYGPDVAKTYKDNIRVNTRTECLRSYDNTKSKTNLFGEEMYADVYESLDRLYHHKFTTKKPLISFQNLLGTAGILTDDCRLYWNYPPKLPEYLENESA